MSESDESDDDRFTIDDRDDDRSSNYGTVDLDTLGPHDFYRGEEASFASDIYPKWRRTPRVPRDFSDSKSELSSCKDSDYDAWLCNYYAELHKKLTFQAFADRANDTSDLVERTPENVLTSLFPPLEKNIWSLSTKYWGPKDARRHWPLRVKRGKYIFVPSIHPHLNLRSRYGRYLSLLNSAAAVPEYTHKRFICGTFKNLIQNLEGLDPQLQKIMICDTLCNLKWFDYMAKKVITGCLCRLLRKQENMEKVYFENTSLEKLEGITLLCALSRNGGDVVQELHLWKMFGYGQSPLLLRELSRRGDFVRTTEKPKFFTKIHYLQVLNKFTNLTHLSVNYSYLANRKGDALLSLECIRLGCLQKLRLLCLMDERPLLTNPGHGVGGWKIADGVWRLAAEWCPNLRVSFVFLNMAQYENIIVFLSKSIPVSDVYVSSGIDFSFNVPWDVDSTLLELRNWYSGTLESLSLHLWHHRDLLDFVIRCKVLDEFPNLINFEFIGVLEDVETLEQFCCQLSKGNYKLKTLLFWVEDQHTDREKLSLTRRRVEEIRSKYKKKFLVIDVDADLQTWKRFVIGRGNELVSETHRQQLQKVEMSMMKGKHLIVSISPIQPYVYYIVKDDAIILQGSFGQLWKTLEERLGFTSEYMIENYYVGVANFESKRRDVLLRPTVISSDDVEKFDFTFPVGSTWYELYLKDSDEINSSNSYVRNWSMGIWFFTAAMIFLFTVLLYLMLCLSDKFLLGDLYIVPGFERTFRITQTFSYAEKKFLLPENWRKIKKEYRNLKMRNDKSLGNCLIAAISVFCSQGVYLTTNNTSIRLSMLSFLLFGMIMFNSYSALLVSQLTLGERFLPFDTLEEIPVKGQEYSLCVRPESYPYLYFSVNNSKSKLQPKWENIINRKPCPEEGLLSLEEMCQPYVAFLEAPAVMKEFILANENCKMTNLRGRYFNVDFSLMIIKGFEENAKKELNMEVIKYREVGILAYLEEKWLRQSDITSGTENQNLQVTFEHVKGILFIYACSLAFSASIFLLEMLFHLKRNQIGMFL